MLRRFRLIKQGLQSMVISTQWNSHRQDEGASFVRKTLLNERWWDKVDYILSFVKVFHVLNLFTRWFVLNLTPTLKSFVVIMGLSSLMGSFRYILVNLAFFFKLQCCHSTAERGC
ncbi:hypothetical protein RHMOL_Rhmol11G0036600 [Rhododendron molle]|nr:hypothetical protein RHMOL_Rhmol11G0036600 [Rhododendron molle]